LAKEGADGGLEFTWSEPEAGVSSVRIFAAPKATALGQVRLAHLIGIIESDGSTVWNMDPLHAAGFIRDAARTRWGVDIGASPDVPFLADRLAVFDRLKGMVAGANPVTLKIPQANDLAFYAASVNSQGEQSLLVPVEVPVLAVPVAAPAPAEPTAPAAADDPFGPAPEQAPAVEDPFGAPPEPAPAAQDPFAAPPEPAPVEPTAQPVQAEPAP
jgi:hypothetical protein